MDVDYIMYSAAELGLVTPVELAAVYLLDPAYMQVDRLIAENAPMGDHFLQNTARDALRAATVAQQHWVALNSLRSTPDLARALTSRAEDVIRRKIQSDLGKAGPVRLIEGTVENADGFWSEQMVQSESDVTETVARAILTKHMGSLVTRLHEDLESVDAALQWYQRDGGAAFRQLQMSHRSTVNTRESLSGVAYAKAVKSQKARFRRENKRPVRATIKKVTKLFEAFNQENNLRLFVSGKEVELSHPKSKLKFVLRPLAEAGWLEDRSAKGRAHTPYDLSVLTKDDVFVSKLCVYFSDTPVLDQLLAMSLFVQSGDELKVLEEANFYGYPDGFDTVKKIIVDAYPSLAHRFPDRRAPEVDEFQLDLVTADGGAYPVIDLGAPFRAEDEHWEPFKGRVQAWVNTWFEPVFEHLLPQAELLKLA